MRIAIGALGLAGVVAMCATTAQASITFYNQANPPTPNAGGTANFGAAGLNLTLADSAFTVDYAAPDAGPLPASVSLNSLAFVRGTNANSPSIDTSTHYLKVFNGVPSPATFVGVSTNAQNFDDGLAPALQSYTFGGITLSTTTNYIFAFASNGAADATGIGLLGRVQGSNAGSDTYASGSFLAADLSSIADGTSRDPMLLIVATAVPEPTTLVAATIALTLLRRRRDSAGR